MGYMVKAKSQHQNPLTDWCHENKIEGYSIWVSSWNNRPYDYLFEFLNEEDMMAFKLRWG